jgi:hypothetical protein
MLIIVSQTVSQNNHRIELISADWYYHNTLRQSSTEIVIQAMATPYTSLIKARHSKMVADTSAHRWSSEVRATTSATSPGRRNESLLFYKA